MSNEPIVAVGLLTKVHLRMLGSSLKQVFPIDQDDTFDSLIAALDQAQNGQAGRQS